jgi:hypothetical protein
MGGCRAGKIRQDKNLSTKLFVSGLKFFVYPRWLPKYEVASYAVKRGGANSVARLSRETCLCFLYRIWKNERKRIYIGSELK